MFIVFNLTDIQIRSNFMNKNVILFSTIISFDYDAIITVARTLNCHKMVQHNKRIFFFYSFRFRLTAVY